MSRPAPPDQAARDAIRGDLDRTLFVEAGAGSGKTSVLVDRVVALVESGVEMPAVAAITFTEKAAAELRARIRSELERRPRDERVQRALDSLDTAAICTLHAFAQRLITAFPVEAGLPPRVEVRDEIVSSVAFEARWQRCRGELLDDPADGRTMLLAVASGMKFDWLRSLAEQLADNWDLLDRVPVADVPAPIDLTGWLAAADRVVARRDECTDPADTLCIRLDELAASVQELRAASDDVQQVELFGAMPARKLGRSGRSKNWRDLDEIRAEVTALAEARERLLAGVQDAVLRRLGCVLAELTAADASERCAAGTLDFHDLLVVARRLLRDPEHGAGVRARLRERYQRLLIDEFQDTDPIQLDLAVLLGSGDDEAGVRRWDEVEVEPGRLFFVGDPKQSIYRFRRADIATFLAARDHVTDRPLQLTCNFRSSAPVLDWVNGVFADLIVPAPGSQPEYQPLTSVHPSPPTGPAVVLLGTDLHEESLNAEGLRLREADDVVAAVRTAIDARWSVRDGSGDEWRDARLGDVCILLPARTSLPYLERALEAAGIPYRAETSSLVYATREVRDLLLCLRAIDDPTDELAVVQTLRSSLFGCGDDDLWEFHVEHGGGWYLLRPLPDSLPDEHPVADALRYLRGLHDERQWLTASELLERLVRDRGVFEVGHLGHRFRDVTRRVRFVVDQARAFTESTGHGLRDYLAWAARLGAEGSRVVETVLPETDDDAVRILTVHGAKGLEFPIVIVSGTTTQAQGRRRGVELLFPPDGSACQIRMSKAVQTADFELHKPLDEQMGAHERLRLLYVACTRARDHLVISTHRKERTLSGDRASHTLAELVWEASPAGSWARLASEEAPSPSVPAPAAVAPPPERSAWERERADAFGRGRRRRFVAATTLAARRDEQAATDPGLQKSPRDLDAPPWLKGRYGTAIGRAVHAVLQVVDLATGTGVDAAAAAQAAAEGILGHEARIAALARAAIASDVVRAATASTYWRETYVAAPLDGCVLEGYVDLLYRDGDGLVVVDYKTDAVADDEDELARRVDHYRVQGATYAVAVAAATGMPVRRCVFLFLLADGTREVVVEEEELDAAMHEVAALAAQEQESPVSSDLLARLEP